MLTSLALIFLCGLFLGSLFKKLRLPSLIGMLIAGIVLGPYALNLMDDSILSISADLRKLALIIILTRAGLSLKLNDLKKIGRPAVLMSFLPATFEMVGTMLIAQKLFSLPFLDAAVLASVISSASPAVIVPSMLKLMDKGYGTNKSIPQLVLAGASVDDVFNIVVFTSFLSLAERKMNSSGLSVKATTISPLRFLEIPVAILLGVLIGILVGTFLSQIFKHMHMRDSVKVIILLSSAFLLVALEDFTKNVIPFSGLLAVMASGVILFKNIPPTVERISSKFSKLWVGAEIMLFVLVGASVNIQYASSAGLKAIAMLVGILLFRMVGVFCCLIKTNLNGKERLFCALANLPKATVQAAIGAIPLSIGLASGETILTVAVFSVLFTAPLGAFVIESTYKMLLTKTD